MRRAMFRAFPGPGTLWRWLKASLASKGEPEIKTPPSPYPLPKRPSLAGPLAFVLVLLLVGVGATLLVVRWEDVHELLKRLP